MLDFERFTPGYSEATHDSGFVVTREQRGAAVMYTLLVRLEQINYVQDAIGRSILNRSSLALTLDRNYGFYRANEDLTVIETFLAQVKVSEPFLIHNGIVIWPHHKTPGKVMDFWYALRPNAIQPGDVFDIRKLGIGGIGAIDYDKLPQVQHSIWLEAVKEEFCILIDEGHIKQNRVLPVDDLLRKQQVFSMGSAYGHRESNRRVIPMPIVNREVKFYGKADLDALIVVVSALNLPEKSEMLASLKKLAIYAEKRPIEDKPESELFVILNRIAHIDES